MFTSCFLNSSLNTSLIIFVIFSSTREVFGRIVILKEIDPEAMHVNAFSISWRDRLFYAFSVFAVIGKVLHKIVLDIATGIIVVPNWLTQPLHSLLMKLLIDISILLHSNKTLLLHPTKSKPHPLANKLNMLACVILGKNQE